MSEINPKEAKTLSQPPAEQPGQNERPERPTEGGNLLILLKTLFFTSCVWCGLTELVFLVMMSGPNFKGSGSVVGPVVVLQIISVGPAVFFWGLKEYLGLEKK